MAFVSVWLKIGWFGEDSDLPAASLSRSFLALLFTMLGGDVSKGNFKGAEDVVFVKWDGIRFEPNYAEE